MYTFYAVLPRIRANKANIIRFIVVVFMNRHLSPGLTTLFPHRTRTVPNEKWMAKDKEDGNNNDTTIDDNKKPKSGMEWLRSLFLFFPSFFISMYFKCCVRYATKISFFIEANDIKKIPLKRSNQTPDITINVDLMRSWQSFLAGFTFV